MTCVRGLLHAQRDMIRIMNTMIHNGIFHWGLKIWHAIQPLCALLRIVQFNKPSTPYPYLWASFLKSVHDAFRCMSLGIRHHCSGLLFDIINNRALHSNTTLALRMSQNEKLCHNHFIYYRSSIGGLPISGTRTWPTTRSNSLPSRSTRTLTYHNSNCCANKTGIYYCLLYIDR